MRFDENSFRANVKRVFGDNQLGELLDGDKIEKLVVLTEFMLEENEKYNLTAITEPDKIILNHYADCAALAARLPEGATVADVGCGAGFPTLPAAILRPDVTILGIDSTAKRTGYVAMAAERLGLKNVRTLTARAEDAGASPKLRESFDIVTARAVASMRVLSELCLPLVKPGGQMIAMKGKNADSELSEAMRAISVLGGRLIGCESITLVSYEEQISHPLIFIKKASSTPREYPRPYAKILKKPL